MEGRLRKKKINVRMMQDDICVLDMLGLLYNLCYMIEGRDDIFSIEVHDRIDNLWELLNSYWHGRDG